MVFLLYAPCPFKKKKGFQSQFLLYLAQMGQFLFFKLEFHEIVDDFHRNCFFFCVCEDSVGLVMCTFFLGHFFYSVDLNTIMGIITFGNVTVKKKSSR
jgi:hypothetical protein